jgi:hypothetical protein
MRTRRHPHLCELSAWPFLDRLSRRDGRLVTLATVPPAEWDAIAAAGFDLVYLMGIWERSAIGREMALAHPALRGEYDRVLPGWSDRDVPGSPFSIREYRPDERMGGWDGLDHARLELHRRGLRLLLDYVPNHTGFDHPWILAHPDRYVLGTAADADERPHEFRRAGPYVIACGRDPFFPPWEDVAQLNLFNPDTRRAMLDVLLGIAAHCDGVRCDMTMLLLNDVFERTWRPVLAERWPRPASEFWPEATRRVPDLIYLAEVYWDLEWTLQQQGFHFTYDKRLLDRLQHGPVSEVRAHLMADAPFRDRLARFLENHDERRSPDLFAERLPAAATVVATLPGLRFFFDGQLDGARLRAPVQLGRWPDEALHAPTRDLYGRLLRASGEALFHNGEWRLLDITPAGDDTWLELIAYRWRLADALAIVVVNAGRRVAHGHVLVAADLAGDRTFEFRDVLDDRAHEWSRASLSAPGLHVRLAAGGAHLFVKN